MDGVPRESFDRPMCDLDMAVSMRKERNYYAEGRRAFDRFGLLHPCPYMTGFPRHQWLMGRDEAYAETPAGIAQTATTNRLFADIKQGLADLDAQSKVKP